LIAPISARQLYRCILRYRRHLGKRSIKCRCTHRRITHPPFGRIILRKTLRSYWQNLEQVVGPIAQELVAGYPALEEVVHRYLATPDQVLQRRLRVAWRRTLALAGGLVAGGALLLADGRYHLGVGAAIHWFFVSEPVKRAVVCTVTQGYVYSQGCYFANSYPIVLNTPATFIIGLIQQIWALFMGNLDAILTVAAAVAVMVAAISLVGRLVTMRSPFAFRTSPWARRGGRRSVLIFATTARVLFVVNAFYILLATPLEIGPSTFRSDVATLVGWTYLLGYLAALVAWVLALYDSLVGHRWGWFAAVTLLPISLVTLGLFPALYDVVPPLFLRSYRPASS
jgi:hypothetical protein